MKIASLLSIALAMGLSVATWTSPASAAVHEGAARDAALAKCSVQARAHYPGKYYDYGEARDFSYQRCMYDAGQAP